MISSPIFQQSRKKADNWSSQMYTRLQKNINITRIKRYLLYGLLFLLPTQLGTFYFLPISYIDGLRIDYLAPALYATDILALLLFCIHRKDLFSYFQKVSHTKWIIFIALLAFIIQIEMAIQPLIALYRIVKVGEAYLLYLITYRSNLPFSSVLTILLTSALTQMSIATYQVAAGHSVQGGAYFLGERSFSLSTPGIAKVAMNGIEVLRGYGTFSHPNSLAGFYLLIYGFVLFSNKAAGIWKHLLLGITTLLIVLSFSKIAVLGVLLLSAYYALHKLRYCLICTLSRIAVPLVLVIVIFSTQGDAQSLQKRVWLTETAMRIIQTHPWTGVGLGNYLYAQAAFPIPYAYVFLQPVHNIFLLIMAEIGIPLFAFITYLFARYIKQRLYDPRVQAVLFVLILTGMFDHYWLTLQQNFLLIPVVFGLLQKQEHVVK